MNFSLLAQAALVASLISVVPRAHADCHWWQFKKCDQASIVGLPPEAPQTGVVITVDVSKNHAYLFQDGQLIADGPAATGKESVLEHGDDVWIFHTPRGHLKVLRKIQDPVWTRPDWYFLEAGEPIPPLDSPKRQEKGVMGKYALALGDGIFLHGTNDPKSLGKYASHGCIRLPAKLIAKMYQTAKVGTDVYIFDSEKPQTAEMPASDLDFKTNNKR
jgi:L,D-transpeptidase catalytic domain